YATLGDVRDLLTLLAWATRALVLASVALAVFSAVEGRRRSLAVLRALGAARGDVFASVWLGVAGVVSGGGGGRVALGGAAERSASPSAGRARPRSLACCFNARASSSPWRCPPRSSGCSCPSSAAAPWRRWSRPGSGTVSPSGPASGADRGAANTSRGRHGGDTVARENRTQPWPLRPTREK